MSGPVVTERITVPYHGNRWMALMSQGWTTGTVRERCGVTWATMERRVRTAAKRKT